MDLNSQTHLKQEVSNHHHTSITDLFKSEFSWSIYYRNFSTEAIVVRIYALNDWESVSYFPLGWHIKTMNQMPPMKGTRLIKIQNHSLPISRSRRNTIESERWWRPCPNRKLQHLHFHGTLHILICWIDGSVLHLERFLRPSAFNLNLSRLCKN